MEDRPTDDIMRNEQDEEDVEDEDDAPGRRRSERNRRTTDTIRGRQAGGVERQIVKERANGEWK